MGYSSQKSKNQKEDTSERAGAVSAHGGICYLPVRLSSNHASIL